MKMFYRNLVEDEKEALKERRYIRLAKGLVLLGIIFIYVNWNKLNK